MKLKVISKAKTELGTKELPEQFYEPVRQDLIKRAVLALQASRRQPYGAMLKAGMRHSATLSKKRRKYRGSYGFGISRVPRKILSRRGTRFNWEGAVVPGTVGGRRAHPPKPEKKWSLKINVKEKRKAIRSAMAACFVKDVVKSRGHVPPQDYPFIVSSDIEEIKQTSELISVLEKLGFKEELKRVAQPREKPGRGKLRGRRKSFRKGPLIVTSRPDVPIMKAAKNLPGVDVAFVRNLNAELLAPGAHPGRITLFTDKAIDALAKEGFFMKNYKASEKAEGKGGRQ